MSDVTKVVMRTKLAQVQGVRHTRTSVGMPGQTGPAGDAGGALGLEYTQAVPNASWLINHNLNFRPNVQTFDDSGGTVNGRVIHHTANQVEIQFNTARTGTAVLS